MTGFFLAKCPKCGTDVKVLDTDIRGSWDGPAGGGPVYSAECLRCGHAFSVFYGSQACDTNGDKKTK